MKNWDWRHLSGAVCLLGAVSISLYEQFGGKVTLVHDMAVIRTFCFTYAGIMFGNVMNEKPVSQKEGSSDPSTPKA